MRSSFGDYSLGLFCLGEFWAGTADDKVAGPVVLTWFGVVKMSGVAVAVIVGFGVMTLVALAEGTAFLEFIFFALYSLI